MANDGQYDGGILYTLVLYSLIFISLMVPWLLIRKRFPDVYFPRAKVQSIQDTVVSWIPGVFSIKGEDLYELSGRKGILFMRWKYQSILFISVLSLAGGILTIFYMYFTPSSSSLFGSTAASSLENDSFMLWITFFYSIAIAAGFLVLVKWHRKDIRYARKISVSQDHETFNRVIMISHVPQSFQTNDELHNQLELFTEHSIKRVSIAWRAKNIDTLQQEKLKAMLLLEVYQEQEQLTYDILSFRPPVAWLPDFLSYKAKQPAVTWLETRIEELTDEIDSVYQQALNSKHHTGVAFIIFERRYEAQDTILRWKEMRKGNLRFKDCEVEPAKPHEEIIWQNLGTNLRDRFTRKICFDILIVVLAFIWSVPIAFLSNLDNLALIPFIGDAMGNVVNMNPFITDIVEQILPVSLTWLFYQLFPRFCLYLSEFEKYPDVSSIHAAAMEKYWIFIILNGFVFYMLFSSGIDFASTLFSNPGDIKLAMENLDWALYGSFYCTFLLTMALLHSTLSHLQIKIFVKTYVRWFTTIHKTPKRREITFTPGTFPYYVKFAKESLYFAMIMTFAPIVPLVSLCGLLMYLLNYFADKSAIVLIAPREPAHGRKLFLRFAVFLNFSMSLTFLFWCFFFVSHGHNVIAYLTVPAYGILWITCFVILLKTRNEKVFSYPNTGSTFADEGDPEEEKYYSWDYMSSPSRCSNELSSF